jgi:carbon storage regulator
MLVLSRRIGEEIVIDRDVRVVVIDIRGRRVSLGIHAPPSVSVNRSEIRGLQAMEPSSGNSADACAES